MALSKDKQEKKEEILRQIQDGTYVDTIHQGETKTTQMDRELKPKR